LDDCYGKYLLLLGIRPDGSRSKAPALFNDVIRVMSTTCALDLARELSREEYSTALDAIISAARGLDDVGIAYTVWSRRCFACRLVVHRQFRGIRKTNLSIATGFYVMDKIIASMKKPG
jgi:hypothetical protein